MQIKVCGITDIEQMLQLDELGIDYIGIIFYPESPRYILKNKNIILKNIKTNAKKVGVFVNATQDEIMKQIYQFGLDMIQLHGDEPNEYCQQLNGVPLIKAFRVKHGVHLPSLAEKFNSVDFYLFDKGDSSTNKNETKYGGTGKKFNWDILKENDFKKPFFLSGGIDLEDAHLLKKINSEKVLPNLFAIDINSKFETKPGIKDIEKIKVFIKELRNI